MMLVGFVTVQLAKDGKIVPSSFIYPGCVAAVFIILHLVLRFLTPRADSLLLPVSAGLTSLGIVMIYRLNKGLALDQLIWIAVAAACFIPVSYTHLRAHETRHDLVCR